MTETFERTCTVQERHLVISPVHPKFLFAIFLMITSLWRGESYVKYVSSCDHLSNVLRRLTLSPFLGGHAYKITLPILLEVSMINIGYHSLHLPDYIRNLVCWLGLLPVVAQSGGT